MKLEGENFPETVATPELIRTMVRDKARRGEYKVCGGRCYPERAPLRWTFGGDK